MVFFFFLVSSSFSSLFSLREALRSYFMLESFAVMPSMLADILTRSSSRSKIVFFPMMMSNCTERKSLSKAAQLLLV